MTIETKYWIGDRVWFMKDDKPQKSRVRGLTGYHGNFYFLPESFGYKRYSKFIPYKLRNDIRYSLSFNKNNKFTENQLFSSKEELLKSL